MKNHLNNNDQKVKTTHIGRRRENEKRQKENSQKSKPRMKEDAGKKLSDWNKNKHK